MQNEYKKHTRNYELVGKLIEEPKLRKYSHRTGKKYGDSFEIFEIRENIKNLANLL